MVKPRNHKIIFLIFQAFYLLTPETAAMFFPVPERAASCLALSTQRERKKVRHARLRDAPGNSSDVLSSSETNSFTCRTVDLARAEEASACTIARCPLGIASFPHLRLRPCGGEHFFTRAGAPATTLDLSGCPLARRHLRNYSRKTQQLPVFIVAPPRHWTMQ